MGEGRVIRAISGFFDVQDGPVIRRCRARGVFKKKGTTVLVGDLVEYEPIGTQEGVVTAVRPRSTELVRPPITNVNHALIVFAFITPDLSTFMLDKTIVAASIAGVEPSIVLTKADLADPDEARRVVDTYRNCGYPTFSISAKHNEGVDEVRRAMMGRVNVFAGPSGAGKSTLANAIAPGFGAQMGEVSEKIGRGKQTTRHVELFQLDESTWLADAPGFSQLQISIESRELRLYFPDFEEAAKACAYRGCLHIDEVDCGVKRAVFEGEIARTRYESYQQIFLEIREREMNEY